MIGANQSVRQTSATRRPRDHEGRACGGDSVSSPSTELFSDAAWPAEDVEFRLPEFAADKPDHACGEDDERKWRFQEKDGDESEDAAIDHITSFFSALRPIRMTAAATIAITAGFSP